MTVVAMSERELQAAVIDLAHVYHWRVAHFRPALTARGWRTPVEADGSGFPDLLMVRDDRMIAAELKSEHGRGTREQAEWLRALRAAGAEIWTWRPAQWRDGTIEAVLR